MKKLTDQNPIHVIGTDASGLDHIGLHLYQLILSAKSIAAPKRLLKTIPQWWKDQKSKNPFPETFSIEDPNELIKWLKSRSQTSLVLASGDPLWFGIGRRLIETLPKERLHFHPSISSLQLAFARLGEPWQETNWASLHGRDSSELIRILNRRPKSLAILTDNKSGSAQEIKNIITSLSLEKVYEFWICEQLGHPEERIHQVLPQDKIPKKINPLNLVVLIEKKPELPREGSLPLFGIDDDIFTQHSDRPGLMTKREIRIQLLADLELPTKGIIWDIGAGVGSIGLESLRIRPNLKLMSIEKRGGGKSVIEENAKRLSVFPTKIYERNALDLLKSSDIPIELANPDRVILGGGGIDRIKILKSIIKRIKPNGVIVIPLATIEAIKELRDFFTKANLQYKLTQHQCSRGIPLVEGTRFSPLNPIFIFKAKYIADM